MECDPCTVETTRKYNTKLYEPRARPPVRPGELCRRRLDGTLPVSYYIHPPSGGAQKIQYRTIDIYSNSKFQYKILLANTGDIHLPEHARLLLSGSQEQYPAIIYLNPKDSRSMRLPCNFLHCTSLLYVHVGFGVRTWHRRR